MVALMETSRAFFAMKGRIAMNFRIFFLIYPIDVELAYDGKDNLLRFFQIGIVMSSEFSKMFFSD